MQDTSKSTQLGQVQQLVQVAGKILLLRTSAGNDACNQPGFFGELFDVPRFRQRVWFIHIAFGKNGFFDGRASRRGKIIIQEKTAVQLRIARAP